MNPQPATTEKTYRADIDGLRALAILSVVLYHCGLARFTGGFTGVDIFFVISGYLIGGQIWSEQRAANFTFRAFYRRRAKRILPAFYAVLAFTLAAGLLLLSPSELAQLARSAAAATLSASNILFWSATNYFSPRSQLNPLLMTWTLGVEEQFYVVIPLLIVFIARFRRNWVLPIICIVSAASLAFAWLASANHPMTAFYLLPARAWELGAGVALAVAEFDRPHCSTPRWFAVATREAAACLALLLMVVPIFALKSEMSPAGVAPLFSVAGAVLALAFPGSFIHRRLLSAPPLRFLGKISYSWYLWHWPLIAFMHNLYPGALPAVRTAQTITLSLVLAVGSYYLIEQPFRNSRRAAVPLLIRYAAVSGVMAALCAALWLNHGLQGRAPTLAGMESAAHQLEADPCLANLARDTPDLSPACRDATPSKPLVALWGDSHAAALAPGLRGVAQAQGYGLALFAKASCPPLLGATHAIPRVPLLAAGCARFNRQALAEIASDPRVRIVILHATWAAPLYRDWQDGWLVAEVETAAGPPTDETDRKLFVGSLRAALLALQQAGKQTIILEDVPTFEIDPSWRAKTRALPIRWRFAQWLGVQADSGLDSGLDSGFDVPDHDARISESTALLRQAAAGLNGVEIANLKTSLCTLSGVCAYRRGYNMLYVDSSHLSASGALFALRDFQLPRPQ